MPKKVASQDLERIVDAAGRFPEGASLEDLLGVTRRMPRRTLQRRLARLVEDGKLLANGEGPARRYIAARPKRPEPSVSGRAATAEITISPESLKIRENVRRSIQRRRPVGYNRKFLDSYRPNQSFYLGQEIRLQLASMGRSSHDQPAGTYARHIFNRLLIDLSWNSSRLEGNTYSLLETERLLELGEAAEGKTAREAQMIYNHKRAIEMLVDQAAQIGFNRYTILNLHATLADNLLGDPQAPGRLRTTPVGIGNSVFHPLEVPQLIEECFQQVLDTAEAIRDPFEQAFFAMVHLPYLQPFDDANKRVSRLAANIPLIRLNLCPLSFVDVPEKAYIDGVLGIYELNQVDLLRDVFVWAYERSCARYSALRQSLGEPDPFRLRNRAAIAAAVSEVIRGPMNKKTADGFVQHQASERVSAEDRARFVEVVETELMNLHEGNFARYRVTPGEFKAWQRVWIGAPKTKRSRRSRK